jgi:transposase InsO family protein
MNQRLLFLADYQRDRFSFAELCARFGISRKTGYKLVARYEAEGTDGLKERSRRPRHCPFASDPNCVAALLDLRHKHPTWGAKKLLGILTRRQPGAAWPAPSTVALILARHGLIRSPRRRRAPLHPGRPLTPMIAPNAIWTADFKGQFKTLDGIYCFPLTIVDGFSRYLLSCRALGSVRHCETRPVFERLFREYGLPDRIRTDNGTPFASMALGRLSQLSVWWVRLGIRPELIEPGQPQQNGRHERMHRTLKAETTRPAASHRRSQQRRFDIWRTEYNTERPHEALGQRAPAALYTPSTRPFPNKLPALEYPSHFDVRLVSTNGGIRWNSRWVNVSHLLGHEYIGLEPIDDGIWNVYFGPLWLGRFHERLLKVIGLDNTVSRNKKKVLPMSLD